MAYYQGVDEQSLTQKLPLGTLRVVNGDTFEYVRAAEALAKGNILVHPDPNAHATYSMDAVATNTAAVGEYAIKQVITATAGADISAGQFSGMPLFVDDGVGESQWARVKTNNYQASAGTALKIYLQEPLTTALTVVGVSDITILPEGWVEKAAVTTSFQPVVGVAPMAVTSQYYFWMQKTGVCPVMIGEAGTKWFYLTSGDDTEGQAMAIDAGDTLDLASVFGQILIVAAAADAFCVARINCI